jgi:hypothetical protein
MKVLALVLLLFCLAKSCFGQEPRKTKVFFECTCDDVVGALWATSFRDLIASSPRYAEAEAPEFEVMKDADGKPINAYNWHVNVVTSPAGRDSAAVSVVVLLGDSYFVTHLVQTCPHDKVGSCAANALASLDGTIHDYNAKH